MTTLNSAYETESTNCPHFRNGLCGVASEISERECKVSEEVCLACSSCDRPRRLNAYTLTLAYLNNQTIDRQHIQSVIDGTSTGFGTRLANTFSIILDPKPDCGCEGHKDVLDVWTKEYIVMNLERVISWLQVEARKRNLPFSRPLTRILLKTLLATR